MLKVAAYLQLERILANKVTFLKIYYHYFCEILLNKLPLVVSIL